MFIDLALVSVSVTDASMEIREIAVDYVAEGLLVKCGTAEYGRQNAQ